jgi:hypothetical protein
MIYYLLMWLTKSIPGPLFPLPICSLTAEAEAEVKVTLRLPVSLGVEPTVGLVTRY